MRYLKVTIIIGLFVTLLVVGLFEAGVFRQVDQALGNFLGVRFAAITARPPQYLLTLLFAFGVAWATIDIPRNSLKIVIALGTLAQVLGAVWVSNLFGFFFSPFASLLAISLSFVLAFVYAQTEPGSRKRVVRSIFGDRISQKTFAALVNTDVPLHFEGEMREATVIVCEIFNHQQLSASLSVPDYVSLNNSFLRSASDFVVAAGGYLDECDGENIRAVFGTPLKDGKHAIAACECALGLAARLDEVNAECKRVWNQVFDFRIGINSGDLVVATYGSGRLGNFSVAGEAAEWARRLCGANMIYESRILIGAQTLHYASEKLGVRPMDLVRRHPHDHDREEIYELLALLPGMPADAIARRDLFWKGVICFRQRQWSEAIACFTEARQPETLDGPLEFYIERASQMSSGALALTETEHSL